MPSKKSVSQNATIHCAVMFNVLATETHSTVLCGLEALDAGDEPNKAP
jgi:hypothetical protein